MTPHWQLAFVNFYIGTAEGAIAEALEWTRANASPWETSGVEEAADDAYILQTVGEVVSQVRAAALLADRAGEALQSALDFGPSLSADQRAEAAVAIYEGKYLTTKVALDVTAACSRSRVAAPPPPPMASTAIGATSAPTPSTTRSPTRRARSAIGR